MDTSHAHRHVDTCQPAQRRPLDSSFLIPTLAGTSSSGRRTQPRACRCCCSTGFPPRLTQGHTAPPFLLKAAHFPASGSTVWQPARAADRAPGGCQVPLLAHRMNLPTSVPSCPSMEGPSRPWSLQTLWSTCSMPAVPTAASQPQRPAVTGGLPYFLCSPTFLCPGSPLVHCTVSAFSLFSRSITLPRSPPFHHPISGSCSHTDAPQPPSSLRGS